VPVGPAQVTISTEFPYLVGKAVWFFRNGSVKGDTGVTVKSVDIDVSRCAPVPRLFACWLLLLGIVDDSSNAALLLTI
jgi:hypothetical protein